MENAHTAVYQSLPRNADVPHMNNQSTKEAKYPEGLKSISVVHCPENLSFGKDHWFILLFINKGIFVSAVILL